ncbi:MAG: hypothetical protein E7562_08130 [Ruminococcaceae bacterium]|nr:hypothetical protein [Oscillospiraceae bacterium]
MEIKDFIGKTVISAETQRRYQIFEITAPTIEVIEPEPNDNGVRRAYRYHTINGDPFSSGALIFEDETLLEKFIAAYDEHCRSKDGRVEEYMYWLRKD